MIKTELNLKNKIPIGREKAAIIAQVASKFQCTLTFENAGIVLNVKSMIGLLSQSIPKDGLVMLVADGEDEIAASEAVFTAIQTRL
ncbi:MAG: HPr family phosphocarrier protein [Clostridia bacterium]